MDRGYKSSHGAGGPIGKRGGDCSPWRKQMHRNLAEVGGNRLDGAAPPTKRGDIPATNVGCEDAAFRHEGGARRNSLKIYRCEGILD